MSGKNIHWIVVRLLMLIFLYSAAAKAVNFATFSSELSKSPFLQGAAGLMSFAVPASEAAVALMLLINKTRSLALFAYLFMMAAFTFYVYLMMEKAYFLPCACMGLFDSLGWQGHLLINSVITATVFTANLWDGQTDKSRQFKTAALMINPERL